MFLSLAYTWFTFIRAMRSVVVATLALNGETKSQLAIFAISMMNSIIEARVKTSPRYITKYPVLLRKMPS